MIFAKKKKKLLYSWPKAELRSCFPEGMKGILPVTLNRQNKCVRLVSIRILFSTCFHCAFRRMHIFLSFPLTVEFVEFLLALFRKIINLPPLPPPPSYPSVPPAPLRQWAGQRSLVAAVVSGQATKISESFASPYPAVKGRVLLRPASAGFESRKIAF